MWRAQEEQQVEGSLITPVQVFHDEEQRLLCCECGDDLTDGMEATSLLSRWIEGRSRGEAGQEPVAQEGV